MPRLTFRYRTRLTLAGLIALLQIPESHAILLLNIYCVILGLASIASTRSVYNLKDFEARGQGFTTSTAIIPKTTWARIRFERTAQSCTVDSTRVGGEQELTGTFRVAV